MSANTANRGYTYPQSGDDFRPYEDIQELATDVDADVAMLVGGAASPLPRGVIARGRRITSTGSITTTETGVLRIDSVPVHAGRIYRVSTNGINLDTSVDNDVAAARFRVSTSGSASTSSTLIGSMRNTIDNLAQSNIIPGTAFYIASADGTLSVLLSCLRIAGTGNIVAFFTSTDYLEMTITDEGVDPGDTGVVI